MNPTTDTPLDACPHCGCQTKDPFGFSMTIHDVDLCKARKINREMKPTTDTPRTDALARINDEDRFYGGTAENIEGMVGNQYQELLEFARQLERELAETTVIAATWMARAEQAEAEVERLKEALKSCWHAANTYDGNYTRACDNVMHIVNATLKIANPEDK